METQRKVLVVGSGGREHALALRLLESDSVAEVIVCPGSDAMRQLPPDLVHKTLRTESGEPDAVARDAGVALVVIGPEVPLCAGLADRIRELGIPCFGPSARAAALEGSKATMKAFCERHGIDTAAHVVVSSEDELEPALARFKAPPVVKADGLCAGKGVVVAESFDEARTEAARMLRGDLFGAAGKRVVLEERLLGAEASIHAICDGERFLLLPAAQDHKRIFDGDSGPNTGGMGTYAPAPLVTPALHELVAKDVVAKTVLGMRSEGTPFVGVLFAGLMISAEGRASVLEFNVRFGDPETQVLTQIVDGDLFVALLAAATGQLEPDMLTTSDRHALCVVLAARGYPMKAESGAEITGLSAASEVPGVRVLHAGTRLVDGRVLVAGGRVIGVSASGETLEAAHDAAYRAASLIRSDGVQYRTDIGHRALRP